jgi:hypothetical protein
VVYDDKPHVDPELVQLQCAHKKRTPYMHIAHFAIGYCGGIIPKIGCPLLRHA